MSTYDQALSFAEGLPPEDRMRLIGALWGSIENWPLPSDAWIAESQRRSEEFEQGRMTAAPWPEVKQRARRKAGLDG
jgi:putative addiction module component (TIGR02574 family)